MQGSDKRPSEDLNINKGWSQSSTSNKQKSGSSSHNEISIQKKITATER